MLKTNLFTIVFIFFLTTSFAQTKFAPEIGLHLANIIVKSADNSGNTITEHGNFQPGVRGGLLSDLSLSNHFSVQTGLFYLFNNSKISREIDFSQFNGGMVRSTERYLSHNLQIPLYLLFKTGTGKFNRIYFGAGPYFNLALVGYYNSTQPKIVPGVGSNPDFNIIVEEERTKINFWGKNNNGFKPYDYGMGGTVGFEFPKGQYIRGMLQYGLNNNFNEGIWINEEENHFRNWNVSISVGIYLGDDGNGIW